MKNIKDMHPEFIIFCENCGVLLMRFIAIMEVSDRKMFWNGKEGVYEKGIVCPVCKEMINSVEED